jgi:hypothetical protein
MVLRKGTHIKPVGGVPGTESGNVIRKGLNCATFHIQLSQFGCKAINYRINPKKLVPLCFIFQVGKKMIFFVENVTINSSAETIMYNLRTILFWWTRRFHGGFLFYQIVQQKSQNTSTYLKDAEYITLSYSRR